MKKTTEELIDLTIANQGPLLPAVSALLLDATSCKKLLSADRRFLRRKAQHDPAGLFTNTMVSEIRVVDAAPDARHRHCGSDATKRPIRLARRWRASLRSLAEQAVAAAGLLGIEHE